MHLVFSKNLLEDSIQSLIGIKNFRRGRTSRYFPVKKRLSFFTKTPAYAKKYRTNPHETGEAMVDLNVLGQIQGSDFGWLGIWITKPRNRPITQAAVICLFSCLLYLSDIKIHSHALGTVLTAVCAAHYDDNASMVMGKTD